MTLFEASEISHSNPREPDHIRRGFTGEVSFGHNQHNQHRVQSRLMLRLVKKRDTMKTKFLATSPRILYRHNSVCFFDKVSGVDPVSPRNSRQTSGVSVSSQMNDHASVLIAPTPRQDGRNRRFQNPASNTVLDVHLSLTLRGVPNNTA
mgnify:CR=1 FL=1